MKRSTPWSLGVAATLSLALVAGCAAPLATMPSGTTGAQPGAPTAAAPAPAAEAPAQPQPLVWTAVSGQATFRGEAIGNARVHVVDALTDLPAHVIAPGGANVIAPGGANVIAPGGANVIAPGGANVVAPGGLNYRLLGQSEAIAVDAESVTTDAQGRFSLKVAGLAPGQVVRVVVQTGDNALSALLTAGQAQATGYHIAQDAKAAQLSAQVKLDETTTLMAHMASGAVKTSQVLKGDVADQQIRDFLEKLAKMKDVLTQELSKNTGMVNDVVSKTDPLTGGLKKTKDQQRLDKADELATKEILKALTDQLAALGKSKDEKSRRMVDVLTRALADARQLLKEHKLDQAALVKLLERIGQQLHAIDQKVDEAIGTKVKTARDTLIANGGKGGDGGSPGGAGGILIGQGADGGQATGGSPGPLDGGMGGTGGILIGNGGSGGSNPTPVNGGMGGTGGILIGNGGSGGSNPTPVNGGMGGNGGVLIGNGGLGSVGVGSIGSILVGNGGVGDSKQQEAEATGAGGQASNEPDLQALQEMLRDIERNLAEILAAQQQTALALANQEAQRKIQEQQKQTQQQSLLIKPFETGAVELVVANGGFKNDLLLINQQMITQVLTQATNPANLSPLVTGDKTVVNGPINNNGSLGTDAQIFINKTPLVGTGLSVAVSGGTLSLQSANGVPLIVDITQPAQLTQVLGSGLGTVTQAFAPQTPTSSSHGGDSAPVVPTPLSLSVSANPAATPIPGTLYTEIALTGGQPVAVVAGSTSTWVAVSGANKLLRIDPMDDNAPIDQYQLPGTPVGVVQQGTRLVVALTSGALVIYDTLNMAAAPQTANVGATLTGVTLGDVDENTNQNAVYLTTSGNKLIRWLSAASSSTVSFNATTEGHLTGVTHGDGGLAFVATDLGKLIQLDFDTTTRTTLWTDPNGKALGTVLAKETADGTPVVWVAEKTTGNLYVVDPAVPGSATLAWNTGGGDVTGLAWDDQFQDVLYVAVASAGKYVVLPIDDAGVLNDILGEQGLYDAPSAIAKIPGTTQIWVLSKTTGRIWKVWAFMTSS